MACAALALLLGAAAVAANEPQSDEERIVIPAAAIDVKHVDTFFAHTMVSVLNTHMLLLSSGSRRYLVVFDDPCRNLTKPTAKLKGIDGDIHVRSLVHVEAMDCQIDHIYRITKDDAAALRTEFAE